MIERLTKFLVAAMALVVFSLPAYGQETAMAVKVGEKAPDFTLVNLQDNAEYKLSQVLGKKVVMLEFWAPWCDICKREMPELVRDYTKYKDEGFELVSVVLHSGDLKEVYDIMKEKGLNYPVLLDKDFVVATKLYKLAGPIPLKAVIDHRGVVRYSHVGDYPPGENELPFVIEDLLSEMKADPKQ